jgi:hypothetical protein
MVYRMPRGRSRRQVRSFRPRCARTSSSRRARNRGLAGS